MKEDYLTFERYREICGENRETDVHAQETLAFYLHSLGIALNYREDPRLRDTHVLNPQWVTEGIYRILNHDKIKEQKGELRLSDLAEILNLTEYPSERHAFLLELMRKFELCFRFPDEDDRYLIPQLLDKEQPAEINVFVPEQCLNFEYHYPVLPEGLMPRFIVRTCVQSINSPRWRTGVILDLEGNSALIAANTLDKRVWIAVDGPTPGRRRLLAVIRSNFEHIHSNYQFQPKEMVPVPGHPDKLIPYDDLRTFEDAGKTVYSKAVDGQVLELNLKELLDGVDLEETRRMSQIGALQVVVDLPLPFSAGGDTSILPHVQNPLPVQQRQLSFQLGT
jgi:internalin A